MNTRTANQIEAMKKQTIGVEVEMNNITRERAARIAATYFGTGRYENTAARNGYSTWSAWDALGREWKFQKDVSISGPDSEKTELGTPILHCNTWKLALMVSGHSDLTRKNSGKHTTAAGRK